MAKHGFTSKEKMCIRNTSIFLTDVGYNLRRFAPAAPEHISQTLNDMLAYLKTDQSDVLIKVAMAHYQFEMINPFDRYNGIVSRILIRQVLLNVNHSAAKYLSLSESLCKAKNKYFDMLFSTQMSAGYIRWIKFFTAIVLNAAKQMLLSQTLFPLDSDE